MRRKPFIAHICMVVIITLGSICHAANDAPTYDAAIEKLASYRERAEVENALEGFSDIKSDYGNVSLLRMYAEAILNIHDEQFDDAIRILTLLSKNKDFKTVLAISENELYLPSSDELITYAQARIHEENENYGEAKALYEEIAGTWDSASRYVKVDKKLALEDEAEYQKAEDYFNNGEYDLAAEIYYRLGSYKDSAEKHDRALDYIRALDKDYLINWNDFKMALIGIEPVTFDDGQVALRCYVEIENNTEYEIEIDVYNVTIDGVVVDASGLRNLGTGNYNTFFEIQLPLQPYSQNQIEAICNGKNATMTMMLWDGYNWDVLHIQSVNISLETVPDFTPKPTASPTPVVTPEPTPEPTPYFQTLKRGDKNDAVREMQIKLIENNILYDIADGSFGQKTEEAVKRVQEISGLPITGVADNETQKAMDSVRMEFFPQGDSELVLYDLEYDVEEGILLIYYKNTGKKTITELQYDVYECDEEKKHIGDFCGNSGYYTTRTVNTNSLSSGEADHDTFILFEGYEIQYSNGKSSTVAFSDRTKYAKIVLKQFTTQDGTIHNGYIELYCVVR